jgi:uncharacterized membrane protein YphA (DoxX/SURF4 family)
MNDLVIATVGLLLAEVLLVAGVSKLADPAGSRAAVADFGVPRRLAPALGILTPLVELGIAGLLLSGSRARFAALAAVGLLLLFTVAIGANVAKGRHPDCHCFGQLHSAPAGMRTLARNGLLLLIAGFIAWRSWNGDTPIDWGELGAATLAISLALSAFLALLVVRGELITRLLRRNPWARRRLDAVERALYDYRVARARRSEGLEIGAPAPHFALPSLQGERVGLDALLRHDRPVLLFFADPTCVVCGELLPEVAEWHTAYAAELTIAIVTRGTPDASASKVNGQPPDQVLFQTDHEVDGAYRLEGTPTAVLVNPDATIASTPAAGADEIRELVARVGARPSTTLTA